MGTRPPNPESRDGPLAFGPGGALLDSWKAIAAYFQRDIRTVQRWERTEGLPVHRHSHEKAGTVHAFEAELERWSKNRSGLSMPEEPEAAPRTFPWKIVTIAAVALSIAIAAGWEFARSRTPASSEMHVAAPIAGRLLAKATSEGRSIGWIAVGKGPDEAIASPDQRTVYVSNQLSGTVSVIDAARGVVLNEIRVGDEPSFLAITPDGRTLFVANRGGYLSVVDLAGKSAVRTLRTTGPVSGLGMAPDGRRLYLATGFSGLQEVSLPDGRQRTVSSATAPMRVAILANPGRLYINYQADGPGGRAGHDTIDSLDLASGQIATVMAGPPNVGGEIAVSPDGSEIWANGEDACWNAAYDRAGCPVVPGSVVNVIRASDNRILRTLGFADSGLRSISFFPDGSRAVLSGGGVLRVLDTVRYATVEELNLPDAGRVAFAGLRAFCPVRGRNGVAIFDLSGGNCTAPPAGLAGWWTGDGSDEDARGPGGESPKQNVAYSPGLVGEAFRLDGAASRLKFGPPAFGSSIEEMSVAAWLKFGSLPSGSGATVLELAKMSNPAGVSWRVLLDASGALRLCVPASGEADCRVSAQARVRPGNWTHFVVSRSAARLALYVDGALAADVSAAELPDADDGTLRVGPAPRGTVLLADEVQWFTRALSAAEIGSIAKGSQGLCYGPPQNP